jgi:8-oxo-dGTP pyrophosphatase MutT (NUDIX family)
VRNAQSGEVLALFGVAVYREGLHSYRPMLWLLGLGLRLACQTGLPPRCGALCQHVCVSEALRHAAVELLDADGIRLVEGSAPVLSDEHRQEMNRVWEEAVAANPSLFDGPTVVCTGLDWDGPGSLVITWAAVTYRHFALRRVPDAAAPASVFASVIQPTDDGRLLVGRMSSSTAAPGLWQLPGGSLEPPPHGLLDVAALRAHAARELLEETGVDTAPQELTLWAVTRGEHGNVGFVFLAPPKPTTELRQRFAEMVAAETASGREPELAEIAYVRSEPELADLTGPHVDYLALLVRQYNSQSQGGAS